MGTDFVRLELQVYFYWRPCEASTDRKLRKRETGDISIRASPGNALIASISTSTSTSGRDRFFPSAGPKKHASHCHVKPWSNKNNQNSECYETHSFKGRYLALLRRLWRLYQRWHRLLHLITIQVLVVKISLVHLFRMTKEYISRSCKTYQFPFETYWISNLSFENISRYLLHRAVNLASN